MIFGLDGSSLSIFTLTPADDRTNKSGWFHCSHPGCGQFRILEAASVVVTHQDPSVQPFPNNDSALQSRIANSEIRHDFLQLEFKPSPRLGLAPSNIGRASAQPRVVAKVANHLSWVASSNCDMIPLECSKIK